MFDFIIVAALIGAFFGYWALLVFVTYLCDKIVNRRQPKKWRV